MDFNQIQDFIFEKSLKSFDISFLEDKIPVYVILMNNTKSLVSNTIKFFTISEYSHAAISLDTSMNNMYSYAGVAFAKTASFNRESIYSPNYRNIKFFDVFIVLVDKNRHAKIEKTLKEMIHKPFTDYKYNFFGLIEYYLRIKNTRDLIDDRSKTCYFCSEFVQQLIDPSKNTLIAPVDIMKINQVYPVGRYTIKGFKEKDLISKTEEVLSDMKKGINQEGFQLQFKNPFDNTENINMGIITQNLNWKRIKKAYTHLLNGDFFFNEAIEAIIYNDVLLKPNQVFKATKNYTNDVLNSIQKFYRFMFMGYKIKKVNSRNSITFHNIKLNKDITLKDSELLDIFK